jgi:hypothetical protein
VVDTVAAFLALALAINLLSSFCKLARVFLILFFNKFILDVKVIDDTVANFYSNLVALTTLSSFLAYFLAINLSSILCIFAKVFSILRFIKLILAVKDI